MFNDLKKAFQRVQENLITTPVEGHENPQLLIRNDCVIDESIWREFEQEFNICFVEPEDDEEHQLWVENDDVF